MALRWSALLLFALSGCPTGPTCPEHQRPNAALDGCEPLPARLDCPVGQQPSTLTECAPVGWSSCATGFAPSASGWGCSGVVPAGPCLTATRARLGYETCQPVGDCAAPFPPADATLFVDDSFSAAQVDATHFTSLGAALAQAPAGAVVAVEEGTYLESMPVVRPVRIVGRCAQKVLISSVLQRSTALYVNQPGAVEVSGVTIEKHLYAVTAFHGANVVLRDCVLQDNIDLGVYASDPGSTVRLESSVVRSTRAGTGGSGWGLLVDLGAHVEVVDSVLEGNGGAGAVVRATGSALALTDAVVQGNRPDAGVEGAAGVLATRGGHLTVLRSTFAGNGEAGILVGRVGVGGGASEATLTDVEVRGTLPAGRNFAGPDAPQYFGRGVVVQEGGHLTAQRCGLSANTELGLLVADVGTWADLSDCTVEGTLPNPGGILGRGGAVFGGGTLSSARTAWLGNREVGVDVTGDGSRISLTDDLVQDTQPPSGMDNTGIGVLVANGGAAELTRTAVVRSAALGLTVSAGAVAVVDGVFAQSPVAIQAQGGVTVEESAAPAFPPAPLVCSISSGSQFIGNGVKVGEGTVPLPVPVMTLPR